MNKLGNWALARTQSVTTSAPVTRCTAAFKLGSFKLGNALKYCLGSQLPDNSGMDITSILNRYTVAKFEMRLNTRA